MSADAPIHDPSCPAFREWLGAGGSSELSSQERESLERHLAECAGCRQVFEETQKTWELLSRAPLSPPRSSDAEFLEILRERIRRSSAWRRVSALAAAAVLVAGFGLFWFSPKDDDLAVIENMMVLQELQTELSSADAADLSVTDVGRELLSLLQEEPLPEEENWIEILNVLLDDTGGRG